jgi:FG-GAP repeat protein
MNTLTKRALLAALSALLAWFSVPSAFAQQLPQHLRIQAIQPLPAEATSGPPDFERLDNEFGADVAIRNGIAAIGMPRTQGTGQVAVFTQGTTGSWTRTATIVASDRTEGDQFGRAVSYRDNLLIVGSNRAVYIYKLVGGSWREQQKLTPLAADDAFIFAGDLKHEAGILAIGSLANPIPSDVGQRNSLYIFEQNSAGKFVRRARLLPTNDTSNFREIRFARSISMTNAIIVVSGVNAAYIYGRNSSGNWVRRQKLLPASPDVIDFGFAVAVDRGMILVGAPGTIGETTSGTVHGFIPGATGYVETLTISPPDSIDQFGFAIAMFGDHVAVGGSEFPITGESQPAVQVVTYSRIGSTLQPLGTTGFGPGSFPASIAIANNLLLVGAPFERGCVFFGPPCVGRADFFRLNRFRQ